MTRFASLGALFALLLAVAPGAAFQNIRVPGRVIGPDGNAIPGQTVVLHRVTSEGGTLLAQATTDADGRFLLEAPGPAPEGAVFFAATRYDERLYIGPMLQPPLGEGTDVTLEVGDPERALGVAGTPSGAPPVLPTGSATGTPRRWLLLLAPLAGLLGIVVWAGSSVTGPPRERRLLIRIARLDNRHADAGDGDDAENYRKQRRRLLDELDTLA